MSAAGRGAERAEYDYYPTPAWCVDRLLDDCGADLGLFDGHDVEALEPTVGDGAIVRACERWAWAARLAGGVASPRWTGVELRRGALAGGTPLVHHVEGVDFRSWVPEIPLDHGTFDVCIGNPPFNFAESIVRRCLAMSDRVAMLLRVGFLGSAERYPFWQEYGDDCALRVLPDRPSFDGEGTDSATYAWFIWGCPDVRGIRVLATTPKPIRAAQAAEARLKDKAASRQAPLFGGLE